MFSGGRERVYWKQMGSDLFIALGKVPNKSKIDIFYVLRLMGKARVLHESKQKRHPAYNTIDLCFWPSKKLIHKCTCVQMYIHKCGSFINVHAYDSVHFARIAVPDNCCLIHFSPISHFYNPWKRQKTYGFLTFSEGIEMWHWTKIS